VLQFERTNQQDCPLDRVQCLHRPVEMWRNQAQQLIGLGGNRVEYLVEVVPVGLADKLGAKLGLDLVKLTTTELPLVQRLQDQSSGFAPLCHTGCGFVLW